MDNTKNSSQDFKLRLEEAQARFLESLKRVSKNLPNENLLWISLIIGIIIGLLLYSLRWILSKMIRIGFFYYILHQLWNIIIKDSQETDSKTSSETPNGPSRENESTAAN
jgi:uncharacterized protein YacL